MTLISWKLAGLIFHISLKRKHQFHLLVTPVTMPTVEATIGGYNVEIQNFDTVKGLVSLKAGLSMSWEYKIY